MLKPTVKRGLMLDFIRDEINCAEEVDYRRIKKLNSTEFSSGDIIYKPTRELRFYDNHAINYGLNLAKKHKRNFRLVIILSDIIHSERQENLVQLGVEQLINDCLDNNVDCQILDKLPKNIGTLIVDFNPISKTLISNIYPIYEVDSHNIIPARYISDKQEYSAATIRRKIYANIVEFLTEYPKNTRHNSIIKTEQYELLKEFINNKLENYPKLKNNPQLDATSNLSPYLAFGLISSQRVALEVIKSQASRAAKEEFLEELIVRKELSDNFCLYSKSFKTFDGVPQWAKDTLNEHKNDIRTYIYSLEEFEHSKTHDKIWNKLQQGLVKEGKIHGYSRMIWAKRILEWSISPEEALKIAIYLNDKYALDGNNPNGYVGILWSIAALHDRPFTNRFVFGKIRYMKGDNIKFEE